MPQPKTKPRPVNFSLLTRAAETSLYGMLDRLVAAYHPSLHGTAILIYWKRNWKPDRDGQITYARAVKPSDDKRELMEHDLALWLNFDHWDELDNRQREAQMDAALARCVRVLDKEEEPVIDDAGRPVFRLRKPDVQADVAVVRRHGCYDESLRALVAVATTPSPVTGQVAGATAEQTAEPAAEAETCQKAS